MLAKTSVSEKFFIIIILVDKQLHLVGKTRKILL